MTRRILTTMPAGTTYPNLLIEVSCAFGADLTDLDGSGWSWTDITDDVLLEGPQAADISITIGRPDESQVSQASVFRCVLDNRAGKYADSGMSPYWPGVRQGTPVRCRISTNNGSSWVTRFQGKAVGFTPEWDEETGRLATATLEASGPLRVLDQGIQPLTSEITVGTLADSTVTNYWPCDDGPNAIRLRAARGTTLGQFVVGGTAVVRGDLSSYDGVPASAPIIQMKSGAYLYCPTASNAFTASTTSVIVGNITSLPSNTVAMLTVYTPNGGTVKAWDIVWEFNGLFRLYAYPTAVHTHSINEVYFSPQINYGIRPNVPYKIGLRLQQSGGNTTWSMFVMNALDGSVQDYTDTWANSGANAPGVSTAIIAAFSNGDGLAAGHITIRNGTYASPSIDSSWVSGQFGETPSTRLARVFNRAGYDLVTFPAAGYTETAASITDTCGPHFHDTVTNIAREAELTGQGVLGDGLGPGYYFAPKRFRQKSASSPTLTIDANAGQLKEPFEVVNDDLGVANSATVSRRNGMQGIGVTDLGGPRGVNTVGLYETSLTVNSAVDDDLEGYAEAIVSRGTWTGYRYPGVSFALHSNPSLIPGWLACLPQSRIDVSNIAAVRRQMPPDPLWLMLEGWTETINAFEWQVTANTSSAEPWNVIRLAAATGSTGDDICHMDTDSSQLNTSAAAGATSISVRTNSGPLWVQSSVDADSFPFWITVGGLRVQVTAISGASSPQTFTLASPGLPVAKTGSTTPGAGAPINIWRPPVLGL